MKKYSKITRTIPTLKTCLCNKCGTEMLYHETEEIHGIEVRIEGGYYSPTLEDQTWFKFDLCEQCVLELMDSFKIPPDAGEHY